MSGPSYPLPTPSATSLNKPGLAPDPRTSSSQSLAPSEAETQSGPQRRTLLLIYIHGFYGNDQSFRSFPYHVHSYLRTSLKESHVIHTKIYPRYKTYRAIEIARDNFSAWLQPHEGPNVDVILVGHSMGGILAADVVLMPNRSPYVRHPYKHNILGILSLDCPFLGLHPGIVVAGISSLFRSGPEQDPQDPSASSGQADMPAPPLLPNRQSTADPFFNPAFWNDNPFKEAPFVKRIMHFAKKHKQEGIVNATAKHVLSHLEYGGCLADFPGLNVRYDRLRELEDVDDLASLSGPQVHGNKARVRFVNYYTLSSGRKKAPKSPGTETPSQQDLLTPITSQSIDDTSLISRETTNDSSSSSRRESKVSISVEDCSDKGNKSDVALSKQSSFDFTRQDSLDTASLQTDLENMSLQQLDPTPIIDENLPETDRHADLPPIPEMSERPPTPNFDQYEDKDARKLAEREYKQALKVHATQVKARNRAIKERARIIDKRRAKAQKDQEKLDKEDAASMQELIKSSAQSVSTPSLSHQDSLGGTSITTEDSNVAEAAKPKKSKKFCTTPRKHHGNSDPTWVDIYMDGMDEVTAHCGLFFPGPHYDILVGDVGSRIEGWVHDNMTKRMILDMQQEG